MLPRDFLQRSRSLGHRLPAAAGWLALVAVLPATAASQVVLPPGLGAPANGSRVPRAGYDLVLAALADGNLSAAAELAARENRGGIKAGNQRWIDSIATAAVLGECCWELGRFTEAVAAFDEALLLSANHSGWLLSVQFPPQGLRPATRRAEIPWGRSARNSTPAQIPETMSIRQGGADPQQVLQRGGVLAAPVNFPIRPQAIMKSIVIALYRRHSILGELSDVGPVLEQAKRALSQRPAPPNHYSQSWIDIALGTAYWSQGRTDQAKPLLTRGLLAENRFDHPLTPWGLIVLGRIALEGNDAATAAKHFWEASFVATHYEDARALEEAFRWAVAAERSGRPGVPPALPRAIDWAGRKLPAVEARLLSMQAEALAAAGDAAGATAAIRQINPRSLRGDFGRGLVGARMAYAEALAAYAEGNIPDGDRRLLDAVAIQRKHTPRLFQLSRCVAIVRGGSLLSDRQAGLVFDRLLADPAAADYAVDPLGTMAFLATPKPDAFGTWIAVAARRSDEEAIDAAEAARRSAWLATQFAGGRRLAVRRLVEADLESLEPDQAARRAALLARQPQVARTLEAINEVQLRLAIALPGGRPADRREELPGDPDDWRAYRQLVGTQARLLSAVAASREDTHFDFPPRYDTAEIRKRLEAGQLILSFHWTAAGLVGTLESRERMASWQVTDPSEVSKRVAALARGMGLFDPIAATTTAKLAGGEWTAAAADLEQAIFGSAAIDLTQNIDELVIVPDGPLWYVPFELLPAGSDRGGESRPMLRDVCQVSYAPTRSLAVRRRRSPRPDPVTGVHASRLYRGDRPEVARMIRDELVAALAPAVAVEDRGGREAVPLALQASLFDILLVLDELPLESKTMPTVMASGEGSRRGMSFEEWLGPPRKRTGCVLLGGFQSAVAGGLEPMPPRAGDELFVTTMDLLAAGADTAVVSRWRTGGKAGVELARAFAHAYAGGTGAAESWHRAVDLVAVEPPDLAREPRVRLAADTPLDDSRHPFFWAGYLLVD